MMKIFYTISRLTAFVFVLVFANSTLTAQDIKVVSNEPMIFKDGDIENKTIEPSAVEPIGNGKFLLVADDKTANLSIVETTSGKIVKSLTIPKFNIEKPKWEAMANDGEFFYLIGSHAVKLDDTIDKLTRQLAARSHLLRFKLKNVGDDVSKIEIDSPDEFDVTDSLKKLGLYESDPNKNKVKIEGLAIRTSSENKKELFFALREPHDYMRIYSADLPVIPNQNKKLTLKLSFIFEAGKSGVVPFRLSSIEYVPKWNGFFIITSTEDENNAFFGNALWFVKDEVIKKAQALKLITPQKVWFFDEKMKAEGLCVLPDLTNESLRLGLVYDNDVKDTQMPGMMRIVELSRK